MPESIPGDVAAYIVHLSAERDEARAEIERLREALEDARETLAAVYSILLAPAGTIWEHGPLDERCARAANEVAHAHDRADTAIAQSEKRRRPTNTTTPEEGR